MNKLTRITALSTAGVLAVSALAGCSAYNNPEKYITVPEKGAIVLNQSDIDAEYSDQLNTLLETYRETEYTELTDENETVLDGDKVNIDYTGRAGEEGLELTETQLANMAATGYDLIIGSGTFISAYESTEDESKNNAGFEEQLIGHKAGETFDITVTFPDDYTNDETLEGKVIIFSITINSISRAYANDDSTITVDYAFTEKTDETDETAEDTESEEDTSEPVAQSDEDETTDGTEETADTEETETTDTEETETTDTEETEGTDEETEETEEEEVAYLSDVFIDDSFDIDYTAEIDEDATFNDLFKIADYAEIFKGKALGYEYTFDYTVPEDAGDDYADFIGRTVTVTLTLSDATHLPELTDDLVTDYTSEAYTTVADFEEYLRQSILADLAYDAILEATVVKEYPKSERNKVYKNYVDQLVYETVGADPSTMTQTDLNAILTDDVYQQIYAEAATETLSALKERLVLEYLLDYFDITLTNEEYKTQLSALYEANYYYYYLSYQIYSESSLEAYFGKDNLKLQFKATKLMEVIGDYVTVDANA
ncbi:MAG: FKBP-type peptidyl-prolyl cis-trans isomerase [Eubacteriales bacterium]